MHIFQITVISDIYIIRNRQIWRFMGYVLEQIIFNVKGTGYNIAPEASRASINPILVSFIKIMKLLVWKKQILCMYNMCINWFLRVWILLHGNYIHYHQLFLILPWTHKLPVFNDKNYRGFNLVIRCWVYSNFCG